MAERRRYTKKQKASAVALATTINPFAASQETGIPRTTILGWMEKPEYDILRQKTRDEMADGFKLLANLALSRLLKQIEDDDVDPRDVAVAMGIATEKFLLLRGEATARTEHRQWTDELDDDEKRKLREWIDSLDDPAATTAEGATPGAEV